MKVLFLTSFPVEAACTRYRCVQYFGYLQQHGVECELRPFLPPVLFGQLYQRGGVMGKVAKLIAAAFRRLVDVATTSDCDVVFIQREAALFGPPIVERLLAGPLRKPVVFDFDDAIFVPYVSPTYGKASTILKFPQKTATNLRLSRQVIAGNNYLAGYARQFNSNVSIIPTAVDTEVYRPANHGRRGRLVLGWIGSPTTTQYLRTLMPMLEALAARHPFRLKIVGANEAFAVPGAEVDNLAWDLDREVSDFQSLDVGLYPITEDAWSIGKCGFKAVQYMAAGVPCVASPVGVNCEIIEDGVNGCLATTPQEWIDKISRLLTESTLRDRLGAAGRRRIEEKYSAQAQAPRLLNILHAAAEARS